MTASAAPDRRRGALGRVFAGARDTLALVLAALLYLAAASLVALLIVRVGADLAQGIDPLASEGQRPRLFPRQLAVRELALDVLRQILLAAFVVGVVWWRDGAGWRRTLALRRPDQSSPSAPGSSAPGLSARSLALILALWPVIHIVWVTGTAEAFRTTLGRNAHLSSALGPAAIVVWLAYVGLLAPIAEELLMRGALFDRARRFLSPWGAILVTAALFALAHLSASGFARPVSLLPLAIVLGWLRWRTGRLWPCILLHAWSNLAMVAYVLWPEAG